MSLRRGGGIGLIVESLLMGRRGKVKGQHLGRKMACPRVEWSGVQWSGRLS